MVDMQSSATLIECVEQCHMDVKALMAAPYVAVCRAAIHRIRSMAEESE